MTVSTQGFQLVLEWLQDKFIFIPLVSTTRATYHLRNAYIDKVTLTLQNTDNEPIVLRYFLSKIHFCNKQLKNETASIPN